MRFEKAKAEVDHGLIAAHAIALNAVMVSHDGAFAHHQVFLEEMLKNS
jgi:predicted nucleic acid-binding protein